MSADWLRRGLDVARLVATWSKDPSTKCGAVLMDDDHRILGTGFNGFPRGVGDHPERYADKAIKYPMVVHAEANVLIATLGTAGVAWSVTLIVTTAPCARCAGLAIQAGVSAVAYPDPTGDPRMDREPWKSEAELSRLMLEEAGVKVVLL
jgi:dCMP deaminase